MHHTPRVCLDVRASKPLRAEDHVALEAQEQLACLNMSSAHESSWLKAGRLVLLSYRDQIFTGQMKRSNRNRPSDLSFLRSWSDRWFTKNAGLSGIHRFRTLSKMQTGNLIPTLTTVTKDIQGHLKRQKLLDFDFFAVASQHGARLLGSDLEETGNIFTVTPSVRRYIETRPQMPAGTHDKLLVIRTSESPHVDPNLMSHLESEHMGSTQFLTATDALSAPPAQWMQWLANARTVLYLSNDPFDWSFLPLEVYYFNVPCIISKNNHALVELVQVPEVTIDNQCIPFDNQALLSGFRIARDILEAVGAFDPLNMGKQYLDIYDKIFETVPLSSTEEACCHVH